jgi:nucleoside-diphosphate-sugar epimerase
MSILVTGGAGLIGGSVKRALEARGEEVVAIDRIPGDGVEVADLTEVHRLHELVDSATAIIHCGAISGPMVAPDNPHLVVQSNIVGTANILEVARIRGIRRVVFCSSVTAFGNTPEGMNLVPEDVVLAPTSVYAASKVAGEALVDTYSLKHGLDGVSLRIGWVYGPHRTTDCAIRTMILDAQAGRPTRYPFGRDFYRRYVHIDDVTAALLLALDVDALQRRVFTVTGGSYATLGEIAEVVKGSCHLPISSSRRVPIRSTMCRPALISRRRIAVSAIARGSTFRREFGLTRSGSLPETDPSD